MEIRVNGECAAMAQRFYCSGNLSIAETRAKVFRFVEFQLTFSWALAQGVQLRRALLTCRKTLILFS